MWKEAASGVVMLRTVMLRTRMAHVRDRMTMTTGTAQAETNSREIKCAARQGDIGQEAGSRPQLCPDTSHTSAVGGLGTNHHLFLQAPRTRLQHTEPGQDGSALNCESIV